MVTVPRQETVNVFVCLQRSSLLRHVHAAGSFIWIALLDRSFEVDLLKENNNFALSFFVAKRAFKKEPKEPQGAPKAYPRNPQWNPKLPQRISRTRKKIPKGSPQDIPKAPQGPLGTLGGPW